MANSNQGPDGNFPGGGADNQVVVIDTTVNGNTTQKSLKYLGRTSPGTKTADVTATPGQVLVLDATAAVRTVTLPTPVKGQQPITVKRSAGSNNVSVVGTIDGGTNTTVTTTVKTFVALDDASGYVSI
jgi:hypothetical protein